MKYRPTNKKAVKHYFYLTRKGSDNRPYYWINPLKSLCNITLMAIHYTAKRKAV